MSHPSIEAAFGLRAHAGSREALLRAAFDLVDTLPGLKVRRRSLVWSVPTDASGAPEELAAAIGVSAQLDIPGLKALVEQLQQRLSELPDVVPIQVVLLWAHDPNGTPDVIPVPPVGPNEPERPPMPSGLMFLHPEVPLRASACGPLAEVAELARDPATTRFASEYLATVPPPLLEQPQPFTPAFAFERHAFAGGRVDVISTESRADLLAAVAEAFCRAPKAADPIGLWTLLPKASDDARIALTLPPGASLEDRVKQWLLAVEQVVVRDQLAVRRAVVLDDGPSTISGVLFGARQEAALKHDQLRDVAASVDPLTGGVRAEISVLDPA